MLKRGPAASGSKNINTVDSNNVNSNDDFNFLKKFERKVWSEGKDYKGNFKWYDLIHFYLFYLNLREFIKMID
jgi:hypothetical protein